ncbi:hypothetical protein F0562_027466 [Nyssa sinensis]|uniref:Uncharacterized protein n=1 Tax=Nyssa sinensis TaxID=561372 RepID=A0A5J5B5X7_9ASTE|nr:hypothetical protein F0562_027466 [Nyssa sinensis]
MWDMIIGSTSGSSVELPFSAWPFLSSIIFGVILIFYVDSIAEERHQFDLVSKWHAELSSALKVFAPSEALL